jgi:ATP-dependent DNA helicase DinG
MITADPTIPEPLANAFARLNQLLPEFEHRPGQLEMARLWSSTLERRGVLAVEAPTGIGKSVAYLLPALLLRSRGAGPVVVSTHTKALQDQLRIRDLPLAVRAAALPARVQVLKGRGSYLCRRRALARLSQKRLFPEWGLDEGALGDLIAWVEETRTGELEELKQLGFDLPAQLLGEIASDPLFCAGSGCDVQGGCFAKIARREARRSDVVVLNHALLLSDPGIRGTLLLEAGSLVIDEAHQLERVAREQLGVSIGVQELARLATRTDSKSGALRLLGRALRRGRPSALPERIASAEATIRPILEHAGALARDLERLLPRGQAAVRLTRDRDLAEVSPSALDELLASTSRLVRALEGVLLTAEEEGGRTLKAKAEEALDEVRARALAWAEVERALRSVSRIEDRDAAFYIDRDERGSPRWNRRPLRVGDLLRAEVLEPVDRVLLTSATLGQGEDFGPFLKGVGLDRSEAETARLPSPFALERQVLGAVVDGLEPTHPGFVERLASFVVSVAVSTRRNTLVLFTSYQMLLELADLIRSPLAEAGLSLYHQAPGEAAALLAREFRNERGAVLLGTASFWEGIDFPGPSLEILIVARLPFPVPTDPVISARSEQIEAEGGDPFRELMLPEAVLRFRQGIGRLIRTATDRGAMVVVDPRIVRAAYGARFLGALPRAPLLRAPEGVAEAVHAWFAHEDAPCPA